MIKAFLAEIWKRNRNSFVILCLPGISPCSFPTFNTVLTSTLIPFSTPSLPMPLLLLLPLAYRFPSPYSYLHPVPTATLISAPLHSPYPCTYLYLFLYPCFFPCPYFCIYPYNYPCPYSYYYPVLNFTLAFVPPYLLLLSLPLPLF